jgi:hypothetical protein
LARIETIETAHRARATRGTLHIASVNYLIDLCQLSQQRETPLRRVPAAG